MERVEFCIFALIALLFCCSNTFYSNPEAFRVHRNQFTWKRHEGKACMREENKHRSRKQPPSAQHTSWAEVECLPAKPKSRKVVVSDLQQLLPPIPRKQNSQTYVPPQQRPKLAPIMPGCNVNDSRPIHNLMGRYMEPHPPEVRHHADKITDRTSQVSPVPQISNPRSVIQHSEGPLLGRRQKMGQNHSIDAKHHRNDHGNMKLEIEQDEDKMNSGALPSIMKSKNVTCKPQPPSTPRITGGARKRWRNATLGQKN